MQIRDADMDNTDKLCISDILTWFYLLGAETDALLECVLPL